MELSVLRAEQSSPLKHDSAAHAAVRYSEVRLFKSNTSDMTGDVRWKERQISLVIIYRMIWN